MQIDSTKINPYCILLKYNKKIFVATLGQAMRDKHLICSGKRSNVDMGSWVYIHRSRLLHVAYSIF